MFVRTAYLCLWSAHFFICLLFTPNIYTQRQSSNLAKTFEIFAYGPATTTIATATRTTTIYW